MWKLRSRWIVEHLAGVSENVFVQNVNFYFGEARAKRCKGLNVTSSANRQLLTRSIAFSNYSWIPIATLSVSFPGHKTVKRLRSETFNDEVLDFRWWYFDLMWWNMKISFHGFLLPYLLFSRWGSSSHVVKFPKRLQSFILQAKKELSKNCVNRRQHELAKR